MIPAAITAASRHVLTIGRNQGKQLSELDDATLEQVINYYRPRDFLQWRAAYLTACARELRAAGLLEAAKADIAAAAAQGNNAARWYLETFGDELQ